MLSLNCAALPDSLLESELFGHQRGAFTGADQTRVGQLVQAAGGTVFLDELGETSPSMQAKLLRALQEREVWPLGASHPVPIDIRLVCATNRNLASDVSAGRFRQDLFYRISVVSVTVPPLRERTEDIVALIEHLLARHGHKTMRITPDAMRTLLAHPWPGNVRELENVLQRCAVMADDGRIDGSVVGLPLSTATVSALPVDRKEHRDADAKRILTALEQRDWNISRVSKELKIPRQTLYRKLKRYRLVRPPS